MTRTEHKSILKQRTSLPLQPTLLTIAGSDPSGGAGIQADIKTATSLGVYCAAAITSVTVQNSRGVSRIVPLDPDLVASQIKAVLADHMVTHVKIGMTGNAAILQVLQETLDGFSGEIVYDPVLAATTGESLVQGDALQQLRNGFLPCISVLTPNVSELEILSKHRIRSVDDALNSAGIILKQYPNMQAVIVKGGHLDKGKETITDYLLQESSSCRSVRQRLLNPHTHGTGCTFSSALASFLCRGSQLEDAFSMAGNYMDTLIRAGLGKSVTVSNENGPMLHYINRGTRS